MMILLILSWLRSGSKKILHYKRLLHYILCKTKSYLGKRNRLRAGVEVHADAVLGAQRY
jgi:hypothetical protein